MKNTRQKEIESIRDYIMDLLVREYEIAKKEREIMLTNIPKK